MKTFPSYVYPPREDSLFLAKFVRKLSKGKVLDVGTGSCFQALISASKGLEVTAVDKSKSVISFLKKNVNNKNIKIVHSDLFSKVKGRFDTIIFNPPYLPLDKREDDDTALMTTGGKKGYELSVKFFNYASNYLEREGIILFLFSSLTKKKVIDKTIEDNLLKWKLLGLKKFPFEKLYVYKIVKSELRKKLEDSEVSKIRFFASGKRGLIFVGVLRNKKVAIKVQKKRTEAMNVSKKEADWLKIVNKKNIGPKLLFVGETFVCYKFVDGVLIQDYNASRLKTRFILKNVLKQCRMLDLLKINKEEMHHPRKHVIIKYPEATLIDFERAKRSLNPHNVTQFVQYIVSLGFGNKRKLRCLASKYKKSYNEEVFNKILEEVK